MDDAKINELIEYLDRLLLVQYAVGPLSLAPGYSTGCVDTLEKVIGAANAIRAGREIPAVLPEEGES